MPHVIAATALLVVLGPVLQALNRSGGALSDARHSAVYLLLATVFIARAKTSSTERLLWWAFAAAQLATALASFVWKYGFDQAPWSPADALFAGKYVAFWLGLAFLLGLRLGEAAPRFWVDLGGMTVLAVAVASVFLVPSIVATSYLPAAAAVLNIGYAAASGVIAITPVTIAALTGRRIRSQDALLTAGFAVLCVADCLYALSLAGDAPSTGWAFAGYELGWEVAPLLLAAAAWARPTGAGTPKPGHPVEWIPTVILTVGGAGILVASLFAAIDKIVTLLAIGALVLAAVRGVLLSGDTRRMAIYRREALTDDLTELPNRRRLFRELELLTRDGGRSGERATLMFLGVDGFRELNDTLGHSAGDDLIFSLARRLEASAGDALLASLGSDEFALIVRGASEHASDTAERLHAALEQPFEYEDITIKLDVTIGLALFPDDASTASELARRADVAMIDAKRRHISTARYRRDRDDNSRELLALATDLRDALTQPNGGLWVAFQPQVELADGACASAEALVRWRHPQLGDISPVQLIPIA
ncbi:MAG: diguanylate cyclase, partial [Patulibacter sp.]|nr:diguanylate cyclase [Patulibacter sp.]